MNATAPQIHVGLFVTCLVDSMRPSVGFASIKLLENAGCTVSVPTTQTCCGQPAYNAGDRDTAKAIALVIMRAFAEFDYVVVPSGSCGGMIKHHIPELFKDEPQLARKAQALADKTYEITQFLTDVLFITTVNAQFEGAVTYHDSCAGLREMGVKQQPRKLLASIEGMKLTEMETPEVCCGFGGMFCVKYPEISNVVVDKKMQDIMRTGATTVLAGDMGCLMNMAGKLSRAGSSIEVRHVVEVLAGMTDTPAIAKAAHEVKP